jgi:hypothetical protein
MTTRKVKFMKNSKKYTLYVAHALTDLIYMKAGQYCIYSKATGTRWKAGNTFDEAISNYKNGLLMENYR